MTTEFKGKVANLFIYHKKGEPGQPLEEIKLILDIGMEGGKSNKDRQLCLLTTGIREWIERERIESVKSVKSVNSNKATGLCLNRFKENILIEGMSTIPPDTTFQIGEAVIKTSKTIKGCYQECELHSKGAPCLLAGCAVFASVKQEGIVRIGDIFHG